MQVPTLLGIGRINVTLQLPSTGGLYRFSNVTYRGVQVGKVTAVDLHTDGVSVTLAIDHGSKVPDNSIAHVYDLSAVGEQYVDLEPPPAQSTQYLSGGDTIPRARTTVPLETATVLYDLERFVNGINPRDLQVIGREGALAFQGTGPQLKSILADATTIVNQLSSSEDSMLRLLGNGATLLHGAAAHSTAFDHFTKSLKALSATLAAKTPTIKTLLEQAEPTTRLVNSLITEDGSAITALLGNLASFSQIQVARVPGLRTLLIAVPEFGRLAPGVVHDGTLLGVADINQSQQMCNTGVPLTSPISGTKSKVYSVGCGAGLARGATNAPRASSGRSTDADQTVALGPSAQRTGDTEVGSYDPDTGLVSTSDGTLLRLGTTGGQTRLFGDNSWQALLLAGTGS
jgi:phospholipid/cholesterol/gamma-HCH transport system substrate-binding protein